MTRSYIITGVFFLVLLTSISTSASGQSLPRQTSTIFSGSGNCESCHAPGSPNTSALLDNKGNDVSPVTLWRSTMMANSAKDPFWQAKVSAEVAANPQLKEVIEDKCTTCHMPMGRTQAIADGASGYTLAQGQKDPLSLDGVSCTVCHQIQDVNLGVKEGFSGKYTIENDRLIYGPFKSPVTGPMQNNVNYTPVYGEHLSKSELCATCHTLFTPYVDNNGEIVGEAPEQVPYLEWKNSIYPAQNTECQSCHMPDLAEAVVISNRPRSLSARSPFAKHYFVGGNVFMLKILRDNGTELGVTASKAAFDSTIARTLDMLQNKTADLTLSGTWQNGELVIPVAVTNKTGHKLPTAYPSRRAWLHLKVEDNDGNLVFESGAWDTESGEILDLDEGYEPHYDTITAPHQVQIYEAVMKDIDGKVNYTLLRAAGFLKDNRIPPAGFTTDGPDYESTAIEGAAANDGNFNRNGATQGTGVDTVTYRISGLNPKIAYTATVSLLYQTLPPRFVEDLLTYDTPEVERMRGIYATADKAPVTIQSARADIAATSVQNGIELPDSPLLVRTWPNPFNPATSIRVSSRTAGKLVVAIYDARGVLVRDFQRAIGSAGSVDLRWDATDTSGRTVASGVYFVQARLLDQGVVARQKILLMR